MAEWLRVGGLMAPGLGAVRPPTLVVYADGRVIAEAAFELRVPRAEIKRLVKALDHDLARQPATASARPGSQVVMDAPTTILGVNSGDGMREVRVPYFEEAMDDYDAALVDARDRLSRLAARVASHGRDYSTDRVRLFAQPFTSSATDAAPWPEGVPLQAGSGSKAYKGSKALAITRLIPRDGPWHLYRTSSGEQIALWWRYLLPHE